MKTYLYEWSTSSLHLEWSYLNAQVVSPCSHEEMEVRHIRRNELNRIIADRAVAGSESSEDQFTRDIFRHALAFIRDGEPAKAAVLFESVTLQEPDSADAFNNYGFCMIPHQPDRALEAFERSIDLAGCDVLLNKINKALCLALIDRHTSAIELVSAARRELDEDEEYSYFLWDPARLLMDGVAEMVSCDDVGGYVERFLSVLENTAAHLEDPEGV